MTSKQPLRCLLYARVSRDLRGQMESPKQQLDSLREWVAREQGWTVVLEIVEEGSASAYARKARDRWPEVAVAIKAGRADALLLWEASRGTRELSGFTELKSLLLEHGVLLGYGGKLYDLADESDAFRTGLDYLLAESESAKTSARVRRAMAARAQEGRPHGKNLYGFRREYDPATGRLLAQVPDEVTGPIVLRLFEEVAAGHSMYRICQRLTEEGIATPRPSARGWFSTTVLQIVRNPAYIGKRVFRGEVIGDASWAPLVPQELWDRCQAVATAENRRRKPDARFSHFLSGIARCGVCGGPMYALCNRGRYWSYACHWKHCVTRSERLLDEYVRRAFVALLDEYRDELVAGRETAISSAVEAQRRQLDGLRQRLDDVAAAYAADQVKLATLLAVERDVRPMIEKAEGDLRALLVPGVLRGLGPDPAAAWQTLDDEDARRYLKAAVEVIVLPATRRGLRYIEPECVELRPTW